MTTRPWKFISIAIVVSVLWSLAGFEQMNAHGDDGFGRPIIAGIGVSRINFVGTFYPLEEKKNLWGMHTVTVKVKDKELLFSIKKAEDLTGKLDQFKILELIWPSVLIFRGTDKVIDPLLKPDIFGKQFSLDGVLYVSNNVYQVFSVTEIIKKKEQKGKKE
ncbi:MAG: hypothetical protein OS130_00660 [Thermodesulfobacteriota bacterium]|jgi:hypothetical protein|nr:MAG: hypothetical protein OS130_00660 [Thermodesulfobacteriota bacterium]